MAKDFKVIHWENNCLKVIDQRLLPNQEVYKSLKSVDDCFYAIRNMTIRGAPLIGFVGIFGMAFFLRDVSSKTWSIKMIEKVGEYLKSARPTAVNLSFEIENCIKLIKSFDLKTADLNHFFKKVLDYALNQIDILENNNLIMAKLGIDELKKLYGKREYTILTICNTGRLACGTLGTALGVISKLAEQKLVKHVFVCETRPYLQGSRLTAFELLREGISHEVIVEGALSYILSNKNIDAIFVGADRIVKNGDTANKIGTSTLSILAAYYNIPFYVVAPTASFDISLETGNDIDIEIREASEILEICGTSITAKGVRALNPSFDITKAKNISGIFCEKGLIKPVEKNWCKN